MSLDFECTSIVAIGERSEDLLEWFDRLDKLVLCRRLVCTNRKM